MPRPASEARKTARRTNLTLRNCQRKTRLNNLSRRIHGNGWLVGARRCRVFSSKLEKTRGICIRGRIFCRYSERKTRDGHLRDFAGGSDKDGQRSRHPISHQHQIRVGDPPPQPQAMARAQASQAPRVTDLTQRTLDFPFCTSSAGNGMPASRFYGLCCSPANVAWK